jgi:hypothetical protein
MTPFMSLRELSQRLASRPDEVDLVARRIRHWTNEKLIETVGDRHSGKGRHRQYSLAGIVTAALLWELSKYNLPVGVLEKILPAIEWIDDHYFEEMELALADSGDEADVMSGLKNWTNAMEGKVPWWITVSYDQASGDYICKSLKTEIEVQQRLEEPSVIILNMKNIAAHATKPV